jgi:CRP-like cAMP-binding protein
MKARRDVKVEHLREVLLFDGCSDEELQRIAQSADEVAVPAGYVLVYEGDWGNEVFVVAEGSALVTAGGKTLAELGGGAVIGELAVLNPAPRTATVTAATAMRFFVFDRESFEVLLTALPLVARRMMSGVASRFQRTIDATETEERVGP